MVADAIVGTLVATVGLLLAVAASSVIVAPGRCRRTALALVPRLRRIGSAALGRTVRGVGGAAALVGATLIARPTHPLAISSAASIGVSVIAASVAIGMSRRVRQRVRWRRLPRPRRAVNRTFVAVRTRSARRTAVHHVRRAVDAEVDPVVHERADLAWWAATVVPGSVVDDGVRVAVYTVVVPGRHGELSAVVPEFGALTLLLATSTGAVNGVSVRVSI